MKVSKFVYEVPFLSKINLDVSHSFLVRYTSRVLRTSLTPTVHGIIEHAPELIEANESKWLGDYTESSLECNNKILRLIRIAQSRKCNQVDNLTDCINRLWVHSDIFVRNALPPKKTLKKVIYLIQQSNLDVPFLFHPYQIIISKNL